MKKAWRRCAQRKKSPCVMLGRGELRKDLSYGWLDSLSGAAKEVNSHGRRAHGNYFQEKIRQLIVIPFFSWKVFQASTQQQLEQGNNVPPRKETTPGHSPLSLTRNTLSKISKIVENSTSILSSRHFHVLLERSNNSAYWLSSSRGKLK